MGGYLVTETGLFLVTETGVFLLTGPLPNPVIVISGGDVYVPVVKIKGIAGGG